MRAASRSPWRRALGPQAALGVLAALFVTVGAACGTPADDKYGSLPKFLPPSTLRPDGVLTGTTARPALTSEGDEVRAELPDASVLVQVTGPEVPGEGLPDQARATTCTWTVTLSHATRPVSILSHDFSTIDNLGTVYHPIFVVGTRRPPVTLSPGRRVTFELRTVMLTGEGLMRWAPAGGRILAEWDFEVEND